jgi:hypothetical protein
MLHTGIAGLGDQLLDHSVSRYQRHRPEQTLLYQIVDKHYPAFLAQLAAEDKSLPGYVQQEFTDFLKCGLLAHGFLRVRCESCHHEKLVAFSCNKISHHGGVILWMVNGCNRQNLLAYRGPRAVQFSGVFSSVNQCR